MDAEVAELLVKVRADIKELKATLGESGNELKKFGKETEGTFSKIGKELVAAFAISKIKDFVVDSIKEFAKLQQSTDALRRAVEKTGKSWDLMSGSLQDYIDKAEETTRFNDDELASSLANLINKTGDVEIAMNLNNKAMDLSVATGMSLAEAGNALALTFLGNERGAMQLARALGVTGEKAKDTAFLLGQVQSKFGGFAQGEDNLAKDLKLLGTEWGNLKEDMLTAFLPGLIEVLRVAKDFVKAARDAWVWWSEVFGVFKMGTTDMKGVLDSLNKVDKRLADIAVSRDLDIKSLKKSSGSMKTMWLTRIQVLDAEAKKLTEKKEHLEKILKGEVKATKAAEHDKVKAVAEGNRDRLQAEKDRQKEELDAERELKRQLKELEEERKAFAKEIAVQISSTFQSAVGDMVAAFKEGNLTVAKSFEILGKAIFKSIVKALGQALVELGAKYTAEAFAALATGFGAPAAPGLFAAGGIAAAAGGSMIGLAEAALADGGVVTRPTLALVGEGGEPEAVVPLSKAGGMGFGGGTTVHAPINLPNVKNPSDFASASTRRTITRTLAEAMDAVQRRKGLRLQPGIS